MNYLLYIILFILTFLFVKISCEFRLYYVITKQNFIIKMLLFAAVIVIVIRSYMENNNIEGMTSNSYDQFIQQGRQDIQKQIDAKGGQFNRGQNDFNDTGYYNRQGELDATSNNPFIQDKINILKKEYIYNKYREYDNYNHTRLKLSDIQKVTNQGSGSLNEIRKDFPSGIAIKEIHNEKGAKYAEISFQKKSGYSRIDLNSIKIIKSGTGFRPGITYNVGKYFRFTIPDHVCTKSDGVEDTGKKTREDCLKYPGTCVDLNNEVTDKTTQDDCVPSGCVKISDNTTLHHNQKTQVECVDKEYIWSSNTTGNTWIPSNTWDIEIKSMATPSTETSNIKNMLVNAQTEFQENPQYNSILGKTNVSNAMQEAFNAEITKQETINPTGPPNDNNKEPPGTTFSEDEDGKAIFDPTSSVNRNIIDKGVEKAREAGLREIIKHNESLKETGANKGLFTGDVGMNFNSAYNDSGELSNIYGREVEQESGSQENISPINLDTYSKDILETIYPPSCTKTINQREKICATLDTHNKCNSSTCCAYNSYNGQNMCVAGDRNGPSTIKSLIDYYYYLGKCYPGKKSCPNKPPV